MRSFCAELSRTLDATSVSQQCETALVCIALEGTDTCMCSSVVDQGQGFWDSLGGGFEGPE